MKTKKFVRTMLISVLALAIVLSVTGGTIAWFTDTVESTGNKIESGKLDIKLEYWDDEQWVEVKDGTDPLFNYSLWEPGYTAYRKVKISNAGTLALKWMLNLSVEPNYTAQKANLADVIDVYLLPGDVVVDRAAIAAAAPVGTLSTLMAEDDGMAHGVLLANETTEAKNLVLKMRESAGNEYQGLSLGKGISIQLLATQYTEEADSFGSDYDKDAAWPTISNLPKAPENAEGIDENIKLKEALGKGGTYVLKAPIVVNEALSVNENTVLYNEDPANVITFEGDSKITVAADKTLELQGVQMKAGGEFSFNEDGSIVYDADARRTTPLINVSAGSKLVMDGNTAISDVLAKGTAVLNINGTDDKRANVTLKDVSITNCAGESGTIINVNKASDVTIEEGAVIANNASYNNNNHGIIRVYNAWDAANPSTVTMNGGLITGNKYSGNGMIGLYYGKFIMNGGEIRNNAWFEDNQVNNGWYPIVYVHSNSQFEMNGGVITENIIKYGVLNSLNSYMNPTITIKGGTVTNNPATNHGNQDAALVVFQPDPQIVAISDQANVTGTAWYYYDNDGAYAGKYITLSDYLALPSVR